MGLNKLFLPNELTCPFSSSVFCFFRGGYLISNDRKWSFLPAFWFAWDELIPANVIKPSCVARLASD